MRQNARRLLESLRGGKWLCGCGRMLYPLYGKGGKKLGVTHKPEDADWHDGYFSAMRIEKIGGG